MLPKMHLRTVAILTANLVAMMTLSLAARAEDGASSWDGDQRGAVRLIAGERRNDGRAAIQRAGVEVRLAPGWKTYWRYPGDSGVPPRFDFAGSENLKTVTVRYPAPQRLMDEGGTSIGYKRNVVFPLDVTAQDPAKPVVLKLSLDYAVCEKLCIPAEGKAELTLTGKKGAQDAWLREHEALVPTIAKAGGQEGLSIRAIKREGKRVTVDVAAPEAADLFAEGPTPDWALPVPMAVSGAPAGQQRFTFDLDGLPPDARPDGATLRLTAVSGTRSIEIPYRLDSGN
jgi:DsbC/DsbD-like thiol-disulfide interchange protein